MLTNGFNRGSLERLTKEELILIILGMQADKQLNKGG